MKFIKRINYIFDEDADVTKAMALEGTAYLLVLAVVFVTLAIFAKAIL